MCDEVYEKLYDLLECQEFFLALKELMDAFAAEHNYRWQVGMNGRSGGYLVLYQGEIKPSGYKSFCTACGQLNYRSIKETGNHPIYYHWWPLFTVLLGTGGRIGEVLGLTWDDLDFENRRISINHSVVYYPVGNSRTSILQISKPKTDAGIRTIPMLDVVFDAFEMIREEQDESGTFDVELDGMRGFIFVNRYGSVQTPQSVNRTIKRIICSHNSEEVVNAKREQREPVILPDFSCHHLRHTFCTRLCEHETNLKVIQDIMGHRNIETTMDIYAEATDQKKQESFNNLSRLDIF